ncbi:hypothetical protein V6N13_076526 [Hibiscus sabdariffa]
MSKVEDEVMASPKVAHSPTSDNLSKKLIGDGTGLSTNFLDNKGEDIEMILLKVIHKKNDHPLPDHRRSWEELMGGFGQAFFPRISHPRYFSVLIMTDPRTHPCHVWCHELLKDPTSVWKVDMFRIQDNGFL